MVCCCPGQLERSPYDTDTPRSETRLIVRVRLGTRALRPEAADSLCPQATDGLRSQAPGAGASGPRPAHAYAIRGEPPQDDQRPGAAVLDSVDSVGKGAAAPRGQETAAPRLSEASTPGVTTTPAPRCAGAPSPGFVRAAAAAASTAFRPP